MSQPPPPPQSNVVVPKLKAIEPPTFHGHVNTVDNWIFMLELYFEAIKLDYHNVDEQQACALACALFCDLALQWYKRLHRQNKAPTTYLTLKAKLLSQFSSIDESRSARDALITLSQKGSLNAYIQSFENIIQHIDDINESELVHKFVFGLKPALRLQVKLHQPQTLDDAMTLAMAGEDASGQLLIRQFNNQSSDIVPMELGQVSQRSGQNRGRNNRYNNNRQLYNQPINRNQNQNFTRGRGRGRQSGRVSNNMRCYNCNGTGHLANVCPSAPQRRQQLSNVQQMPSQTQSQQQSNVQGDPKNVLGNPNH